MGSPMNWGSLTRADLKGFDPVAIGIILGAMDRGAEGRVSRKGHAILRAPGGGTMSVPRDTNKARQVLPLTFRNIFGVTPEQAAAERTARDTEDPAVKARLLDITEEPTPTDPDPTLECRAEGCEAVFVTEGARYTHEAGHVPCRNRHDEGQPCQRIFTTPQGESLHHKRVHLGMTARRGPGRAKKASAKKAVTKAPQPAPVQAVPQPPEGADVGTWVNQRLLLADSAERLAAENDALRNQRNEAIDRAARYRKALIETGHLVDSLRSVVTESLANAKIEQPETDRFTITQGPLKLEDL